MSDDKDIINYETLTDVFERTMESEGIPEEKRDKILGTIGDAVGNWSEDYVLREDVRFRPDAAFDE
jgi:hypothetical protein